MSFILEHRYAFLSLVNVVITFFLISYIHRIKTKQLYVFCNFFDSKIGSLIITVLGVSWAAQVSLYATELRTQISSFSIGFELNLFIYVISLMLLFLLMKEHGQSHRIKMKEKKLNDQLTNLPPKRILTLVADENEIINQAMQDLRVSYFILSNSNSVTESDVKIFKGNSDSLIQHILLKLCEVSSKWDDDFEHQDIKYSANIFIPASKDGLLPIYENPKNSTNKITDSLLKSPFFLFDDNLKSKIDHCDGVLFCQKQYSMIYGESGCESNNKISSEPMICFPYVKINNGIDKHHPNFFGAVQAYVSNEIEYIGNSREVLNDFLNKLSEESMYDSYISKSFIERVKNYYKDDDGKSILSIPLVDYEVVSPVNVKITNEVHAVINLYRDKHGMLLTKERAESFYELIRPLCYHLSFVLSLNKVLESSNIVVSKEKK